MYVLNIGFQQRMKKTYQTIFDFDFSLSDSDETYQTIFDFDFP